MPEGRVVDNFQFVEYRKVQGKEVWPGDLLASPEQRVLILGCIADHD